MYLGYNNLYSGYKQREQGGIQTLVGRKTTGLKVLPLWSLEYLFITPMSEFESEFNSMKFKDHYPNVEYSDADLFYDT